MSFAIAVEGLRSAITRDPGAAAAAFRADSDLVGITEVDVQIGKHSIKADEPPALGGTGLGPNPVELALASLGSCQAITYRVWAALRGIRLDKVSVRVEGDLDLRGFLGVDRSVRPGFQGVRLVVSMSGPESEERYREFQREVDGHCPVLDLFQNPVPVTTTLEIEAGPEAAVAV